MEKCWRRRRKYLCDKCITFLPLLLFLLFLITGSSYWVPLFLLFLLFLITGSSYWTARAKGLPSSCPFTSWTALTYLMHQQSSSWLSSFIIFIIMMKIVMIILIHNLHGIDLYHAPAIIILIKMMIWSDHNEDDDYYYIWELFPNNPVFFPEDSP